MLVVQFNEHERAFTGCRVPSLWKDTIVCIWVNTTLLIKCTTNIDYIYISNMCINLSLNQSWLKILDPAFPIMQHIWHLHWPIHPDPVLEQILPVKTIWSLPETPSPNESTLTSLVAKTKKTLYNHVTFSQADSVLQWPFNMFVVHL